MEIGLILLAMFIGIFVLRRVLGEDGNSSAFYSGPSSGKDDSPSDSGIGWDVSGGDGGDGGGDGGGGGGGGD